jgi:PhnB protein
MVSQLNPYLNFPGTARQAMEYYHHVFGGELNLMTFSDLGAVTEGDDAAKIMHAHLKTPQGYTLMAADLTGDMKLEPGNTITVSISGDEADPLRGFWEKLSDGGTVVMPMDKQSWGDEFGMCIDRFGVSWMVDIGQPA